MKVIVQLKCLGKENTRRTLSCQVQVHRETGEACESRATRVQKSGVDSDLYHVYSPRIKKD